MRFISAFFILLLFAGCTAPPGAFRNYIISHSSVEEVPVEQDLEENQD